ncbi:uncharacterized protein LOC128224840 [Mya arenaria]|uniref:uncharacterized protein LOC128224840 n=1 Tax=Mya arenaria TaxID=6604 RepID=UPI0022E0F304|nr:uncharacterized protein LOC128224840 [Mya arenaria]
MASKMAFDSTESQNWLRQWKAVFVTRRALLPYVKSKASHVHNDILQKASNEQTCSLDHGDIYDRQPIPCKFHEKLRNEIKVIHTRQKPSWKNASTDTWRDSSFAVAKLFMQPAGYDDKSSFDEIDFNGLAVFIYNCGKNTLKTTVKPLSDEARKYVNKIRHMPDLCSSALTDQATTECIDSMIALLNDPDFHGDPEIPGTTRQLDKFKTQFEEPSSELLKYIIENTVIRGIQDITELTSAKEGEWSEKANAIKGDFERLGDVLTSSLQEHGKSANDDIKNSFENARAKLDSCIENAKQILIQATKEERIKLEDAAKSGKLELEQTLNDSAVAGRDELLETTKDGKWELIKTVKSGTRQLEEATADGGKELLVTTMDGKLKLMKTSENITRQLEDTSADGKNELLETTISGKGELKDAIESGKTELKGIIERKKLTSTNDGEEQRLYKLTTKAKSDLQKQLLIHYQASPAVRMNVRLDIDAAVADIYEKPKLKLKNKKDKDGIIKDENISDMNKMFLGENDTMAKTVFVEGEPGTGKSSLCKKIVHDWCSLKQYGKKKTKQNNLLCQFGFLFYIRLREAYDQCKIKDMILQSLIERINSDDKESKELLAQILKSECCLILLDGLDEWKHCSECKRDERIPHVETSWINCTILITTRPYKLAEMKVNRSKLENHVQLEGVQSPEELVRRLIEELNKHQVVKRPNDVKHPRTCIEDLKTKGLWHFRDIPIVHVQIVWLWYKDQLKANMILSEVYKKIMEERWCEMNDKKNIEYSNSPKEFLDSLSKLAFNKLFSENEEDSIVFGITDGQFEKKYQIESLESGIMSCSRNLGERSASYQFLHKTLQEYLSALYLANSSISDLQKHCQHVQEVYRHYRREDVLSMRQMFLFLCGMNPSASEMLSKSMNELFTEYFERDGYSMHRANALQSMMVDGFEEAMRSGHTGAEVCLQHVVLGGDMGTLDQLPNNKPMMKQFLDTRKSTFVSLCIMEESDLSYVLQNKKDPNVLDLETCKNLNYVVLKEVQYDDINLLNLNKLVECSVQFRHNKPTNTLVSSLLSSDLTCLKKLELTNVGWECKGEEIISKLYQIQHLDVRWSNSPANECQLDFGHLRNLNKLYLMGLASSDVVNLHMLSLRTLGVSFQTQTRARRLMAAFPTQSDDTVSSNLGGTLSILTYVTLDNIIISATSFRRFVSMMIQSRHSVKCKLSECKIEPEEDVTQLQVEMENQATLQRMDPRPVSTVYAIYITLSCITMTDAVFRRFVSMMIQSRHSVKCKLSECKIEPEEDLTQLQVEMENQATLQRMDPQPVSTDYTIDITLYHTTMSAAVFRRFVSLVIQSRHSVNWNLSECKIEPEEDLTQLQVEMENQATLQRMDPRPVSIDYTIDITLYHTTMSAAVFRHVVSMVIQSRHSVRCEVSLCKIEPEEDVTQLQVEMENKAALQMMDPRPVSTDYTIDIHLEWMTIA